MLEISGTGQYRQSFRDLIDAADSVDDPDLIADADFSVFADIALKGQIGPDLTEGV